MTHQQTMMDNVATQLGKATVMGPAPNVMLADFCRVPSPTRALRSCPHHGRSITEGTDSQILFGMNHAPTVRWRRWSFDPVDDSCSALRTWGLHMNSGFVWHTSKRYQRAVIPSLSGTVHASRKHQQKSIGIARQGKNLL